MKLGLDFDGTIANWAGAMDRWLREHAGHPLDPERNVIEQMSREQLGRMVGAILGTALTMEMQPEDGALEAITRLGEAHELVVITARDEREAGFAATWLSHHGVPVRELVSTGRVLKSDTCMRLGVDVLLDDSADHLRPLIGTATTPVLFRGRFGSQAPQPPGIHVVERWDAFEALCATLDRRRVSRAGG